VAQTIVVCRLRTVLELGRPRKTMACPTADPINAGKSGGRCIVYRKDTPCAISIGRIGHQPPATNHQPPTTSHLL
jgi:hypothetical protein